MVKPRRKRFKQAQRKKKRYARNREDLQDSGVIGTVPDGAVRNEVIDPCSQDEQLGRANHGQDAGIRSSNPMVAR